MDRPCRSSWTGAHESFQAEEYDAGASQIPKTSVEPSACVFKHMTYFFENFLKLKRQTFNESFMKERLLYIVSDLEPYALV
jgi:hypothetical protein